MRVKRTILVIDDEENIRKTMSGALGDEGYSVETAASAEDGMKRISDGGIDLLLLDVQLPGMDGITFYGKLAERKNAPATLIMSGHATVDMAIQATRLGAFDFLEKPIDPERLLLTVAHAFEIRGLKAENRALRQAGALMVGRSTSMAQLRGDVEKAAPSNGRVLITGENGTGKELVARAIHEAVGDGGRPMITVNCAAFPDTLLETELFGHEKGAFTGADGLAYGKFELASGGTRMTSKLSRSYRSRRNLPSAIAVSRSALVAAMIRASTWISSEPPTRVSVPYSTTRRIFCWNGRDMWAISSRNIVPPLASSNLP